MLKRLGIAQFIACLIRHVERRTGFRCYDDPDGMPSPFYAVQLLKSEPSDTKTMFVDSYDVWFHCIAEPRRPHSNAPVLKLVQSIEEAMTEDIAVPDGFTLIGQTYNGLQTLKTDESDEGHAVLSYRFRVCYGLRCKQ